MILKYGIIKLQNLKFYVPSPSAVIHSLPGNRVGLGNSIGLGLV